MYNYFVYIVKNVVILSFYLFLVLSISSHLMCCVENMCRDTAMMVSGSFMGVVMYWLPWKDYFVRIYLIVTRKI